MTASLIEVAAFAIFAASSVLPLLSKSLALASSFSRIGCSTSKDGVLSFACFSVSAAQKQFRRIQGKRQVCNCHSAAIPAQRLFNVMLSL